MPKKPTSSEMPEAIYPMYLAEIPLKELEGLEIGDEVTFTVTGKLTSITKRAEESGEAPRGSVDISDFKIKRQTQNVFEDLADDD